MATRSRILYVDDSPFDRDLVRDALEREHDGFELTEAATRAEFEARLAEGGYDLVLSDFNILGFEGLQVIDAVHAREPATPVVIVTGTGSEEIAVAAMRRGGWRATVHPDDLAVDDRDMDRLRTNRPVVTEIRTITRSGETRWVRSYAHPVMGEDGTTLVGIYGAVQDITERKQAEAEILQLNQELERRVTERTAQLQAANKELESFSYSVSHDLRAPLRAISGFAEIIARRHRANLNPEGQHYVDNIVQASAQMARLIDDLLNYSRLGRAGVRCESVPLGAILAEIAHEMQGYLDQLHGAITLAEDIPAVKGDPTLLRQIFTNLLENAVTYRQPDAPPAVAVTAARKGQSVVVTVRDNGIGIPAEHQEKIFNIFQRLHSEDEYPGTGIGLATVKKSVTLLGGAVSVESTVGAGSAFSVQLPAGDVPTEHRR